MALIAFDYFADRTCYVLLYNTADQSVWNGSTTETFADASFATYDVACSELGTSSGRYTFTIPSTLPAGTWEWVAYAQAGATPAITDQKIRTSDEPFVWDGTQATSTPSSDNLTTLNLVKDYAGVARSDTTYDTVLTARMQAASRLFEKLTDRLFISATRTEYPRGRGSFVSTNAYPITQVLRVGLPVEGIHIVNGSSLNEQSRVACDGATLTLTRRASGIETTNTLTLSSYATLGSLEDAIDAIGSGWEADTGYPQHAATLLAPTQGSVDAKSRAVLAIYSEQEVGDYEWDDATPTLWGCFPKNRKALVSYVGGYSTIPDDVQDAVAALAAAMHKQAGRDVTLQSEKLGDYSYTQMTGGSRSLAESIPVVAAAIAFYKRRGL